MGKCVKFSLVDAKNLLDDLTLPQKKDLAGALIDYYCEGIPPRVEDDLVYSRFLEAIEFVLCNVSFFD